MPVGPVVKEVCRYN